MEQYKNIVEEIINEHITDVMAYDGTKSRGEILDELEDDTQNVFGNIDGSRTYSTYEAQELLNKTGAVWNEDIRQLFDDVDDDYFTETLKRGAEVLDVVICELLAPQVIAEMREG